MYGIYFVRLNSNTRNFSGAEWVVDGERGRRVYPGDWTEEDVRKQYRVGK